MLVLEFPDVGNLWLLVYAMLSVKLFIHFFQVKAISGESFLAVNLSVQSSDSFKHHFLKKRGYFSRCDSFKCGDFFIS
jgi:hypothetical protein